MGINLDEEKLQQCIHYLKRESLNIFDTNDRKKMYRYLEKYFSDAEVAKIKDVAERYFR
ncbi:DUF2624 family protein [Salimicrobium halophilum]|uniref:DUF2624 family protein n=1 Tax=Salimicrobium halophilum TaxID=86666 RepID=UPI000B86EE32